MATTTAANAATLRPADWSPSLRLARNVLLGAALTILIIHFIVYVLYTASLVRFPFDYDEGEGYEIQNSVYISQGTWPYFNNDHYPFYGTNYPPFFHILMAPVVAAFGPGYWYGRLIVSLCTVLAGVAIGFAVYRETRHRLIAIMAGLAFLASNFIYHIGPLYRQHMVMVMFEVLAVVAIAGFDRIEDTRKRRRMIALSILLLLAAGFTKQMALVSALAVFGYMLLRGVKRTIVWGIISGIMAGAIFGWILITSNGWFWKNVITANIYQYLLGQFTGLFSLFLSLHGALLIMAVLLFLYELYVDRLSVYSIWLVTGSINGALSGKWGAGDSYWAETIAAICILAGIFAGRCLNQNWQLPERLTRLTEGRAPKQVTQWLGLASLVLFILYGLAVVKLPLDVPGFRELAQVLNIKSNTKFPQFYDAAGWTMGYAVIGQMPSEQDIANGWKIVDLLKDRGQILSEEAAFNFYTKTDVLTNPPHILGLWQGNQFDPSELVSMIEAQKFGAVLIRMDQPPKDKITSLWPEPITVSVAKAYQIQESILMNGFYYVVLYPNPAWTPPTQ
ncbi:MAG: hypothetical protein KF716_28725 [Anaerolineae bacterium]|nr:hypothetical protein [Anaerolineae bacterium]